MLHYNIKSTFDLIKEKQGLIVYLELAVKLTVYRDASWQKAEQAVPQMSLVLLKLFLCRCLQVWRWDWTLKATGTLTSVGCPCTTPWSGALLDPSPWWCRWVQTAVISHVQFNSSTKSIRFIPVTNSCCFLSCDVFRCCIHRWTSSYTSCHPEPRAHRDITASRRKSPVCEYLGPADNTVDTLPVWVTLLLICSHFKSFLHL